MFQLLGKAHGSQDLLNPNPLRQQVCLNSFKSLFRNSGSAVEEERSHGWVTATQNQQGLTQKYCLCLNHPCLGHSTDFIPTDGGPSKGHRPHQLLFGRALVLPPKGEGKSQEGKNPNPLVTIGMMASNCSLISPGCSCNPALHPGNPSLAQLPRTFYLL